MVALQHYVQLLYFGGVVAVAGRQHAHLDMPSLAVDLILQTALTVVILAAGTVVVYGVPIECTTANLADKHEPEVGSLDLLPLQLNRAYCTLTPRKIVLQA